MAEEFNLSIYNDVYDMSFNQETEEIHIELKEGYYPLSNNVDLSNVDLSNYYTKPQSDSRYKSINYVPNWSEISGKPTTFTPSAHTHPISEVTNLQTTLDNKVDKVIGKQLSTEDYTTAEKNKLAGIQEGAEVNVNADWNATSGDAEILNKPTEFPPSLHTHTIADVDNLETALNSKQDVLTEDNLGQLMDSELNTKSTPASGDTVLARDVLTNKAVEIPIESLGGGGVVDTSNLVPYTGANKDVNIASNYFETSQGFKKTGGTSSQYLMADGSVSTLTNPITGTGTTNYLSKFTSSGILGNSLIYDNGTNVGIGSTSPLGKLHVVQNNTSTVAAIIQGGLFGALIQGGSAISNYALSVTNSSSSSLLYVRGDGNVGIGTGSPSEKLDVNGNVKGTLIKDQYGTLRSQRVITITGNTTLSEIHNGAILHITNTCNITIPTGLGADFACDCYVKGAFIATFVNGGVTLNSPSGLLLKTDKMCTLYSNASNVFNLLGELATS